MSTPYSYSSSSTRITRRPKWHYPPPPTPRFLHFTTTTTTNNPPSPRADTNLINNNLEQPLFHHQQQGAACHHPPPIVVLDHHHHHHDQRRRERVESGGMLDEEKWKFEGEMLRAECNLLRMEKEIAVNKLNKTRSIINTTLTSTLKTLLSARINICNGINIGMVLDQQIHHLTQKLHKFQNRSRDKDSQVSVLQRRLKKEFQEMAKISLKVERSNAFDDNIVANGKLNVEILRRKMEGLSKGMLLQKMEEEYNSLLSTATSSVTGSASSSKRIEFQDTSSSIPEKVTREGNLCSGHCKTIIRRIVEQVRVETEQWSQMQEMLGRVREEMEELQSSRDIWKDRAMQSEFQTQPLHNAVQEWRQRAVASESKTNELEEKISLLNGELESLRKEKNAVHGTKCSPTPPLDTQNVSEKRVVVCNSKENRKHNEVLRNGESRSHAAARGGFQATKRSPLQDIGNNSSLSMRQNGKVVSPLHCHLSSNVEKTR
ncbi:hypothetical protein TanjilG_17436 [Lupinus angustifolius]|uniref:Uncharacterized protein n=1 Tax=Lupinus angustifolius TaxID=3871 RepID=A0A4P1R1J7_LUPAN|nr:hypothetical protein TanjilG_17436 [Lupinus angustifolius]